MRVGLNKVKIWRFAAAFAIAASFLSGLIREGVYADATELAGVPANLQVDTSVYASGGGVTISWSAPANTTSANEPDGYAYYIYEPYTGQPLTSASQSTTSLVLSHSAFVGGMTYNVQVAAYNSVGYSALAQTTFTVPGTLATPLPSATISGVSFGVDGTGNIEMTVTGQNFVSPTVLMSNVTLNGVALPYCMTNFPNGYSIAAILSVTHNPSIVSDAPPCYLLYAPGGTALDFMSTQFHVILPSTFNTAALGSIQTTLSQPFYFNTPSTPTVTVNGTRPINSLPVIPAKPTFSGVAVPNSHVVVMVHSDPTTCEATADDEGNWSCTLPDVLPAGTHTARVVVTDPSNNVTVLGPYTMVVTAGLAVPNTGVSAATFIDHGGIQSSSVALIAIASGLTLVVSGIFISRRR